MLRLAVIVMVNAVIAACGVFEQERPVPPPPGPKVVSCPESEPCVCPEPEQIEVKVPVPFPVLEPSKGALMLELNARPGLAIQIANQQGLAVR